MQQPKRLRLARARHFIPLARDSRHSLISCLARARRTCALALNPATGLLSGNASLSKREHKYSAHMDMLKNKNNNSESETSDAKRHKPTMSSGTDARQKENVRKSKHEPNVKYPEAIVNKTELCYVTSVDRGTRTFFTQFCRYSNDELISQNLMIKTYCLGILEQRQKQSNPTICMPKSPANGLAICAKYSRDNNWYRAVILSRNTKNATAIVFFIDYGNVEELAFADMIEITPDQTFVEWRPFGVTCFLEGSDSLSVEDTDRLLGCLYQTYIMIKPKERQSPFQYLVEIPLHAYNVPFWSDYEPGKIADRTESAGKKETTMEEGTS